MTKKNNPLAVIEEEVRVRHLWILPKKEKIGRKNVVTGFLYYFVCECSNMPQSIGEDQFLNRLDIICEKCEWIGKAEWTWPRKEVKPERIV